MTDEPKYLTMKQVAAALNVPYHVISGLVRLGLISPALVIGKNYLFSPQDVAAIKLPERKTKPGITPSGNDEDFIQLYREGKTLEEIGIQYNLTRERVRQRLAKAGITKHEGGCAVKTKALSTVRAIARKEFLEKQNQRRWRLSVDDMEKIRATLTDGAANKLCAQYQRVRDRSQREKIPFSISFADYVDLMKPFVNQYRRGGIVLHRIDPNKGYENGNLVPLPHSQSSILGKRQQKILDLYKRDLSVKDISAMLGITPQTVSSVLTQIKNKLKFTEAA